MPVVLPPKGRDLRLDLFRGVANWQVFINHIPNNIFNWVTTLYYGLAMRQIYSSLSRASRRRLCTPELCSSAAHWWEALRS